MPPTPGEPGLRPALCGLSRDATRLPIPRRRGPHRPRTRVAALETMRGPGPACLVGVSVLQTVSKTEACAPATLGSLRRELRASRGWSKLEGGGGGRGLHPTPPRSQAEPKLGGSSGLPAARSPPRGPRRPRDSPGGDAHSPPVARRTIPLPSTFGGRGPRAWAALPTELTPPERGFASSPLPRLVGWSSQGRPGERGARSTREVSAEAADGGAPGRTPLCRVVLMYQNTIVSYIDRGS